MAEPKGASAAVSATMGKAKLLGLVVDKGELTGKDGAPVVPVLNVSLVSNLMAALDGQTRGIPTAPPKLQTPAR